jgi:hypothetical protein
MTAPASTASRTRVEPRLGPLAKQAASMPLGAPLERKHRLLLVLLGAFADAGERSPRARELCARLGIDGPKQVAAGKFDKQLRDLERAGLLEVRWHGAPDGSGRNVYELHLGGGA